MRGRQNIDLKQIKINEPIYLNDVEVTAYDAGHILGSVQYKIQTPEMSVLYTGDINCVDTLTTKAANPVSCDVLILEATYGLPFYVFPEREKTYLEIVNWVLKQYKKKRLPVFQAYSAGKAQEVVKLLNTFTQIPVVTHPAVSKVNRVYMKHGVSLDFIDMASEEGKDLVDKQRCVYILPNSRSTKRTLNKAWAIVTGWALKFKKTFNKVDYSFPLSSHADFIQLKNYVEKVAPKKMYTVHGYKEEFAKYVQNRLGIRAAPLAPLNQRRLAEYL